MSQEDRAQELEATMWAVNNRPRTAPKEIAPGEPGYGPAECDECEDAMPPERRARGKQLCTTCQSARERRQRLLGATA
ncbi:hypothetical protein [Burkholderia anthina]|uniref:hypothetical protein n=1 Tax=Burkholderia anthina TaxID=179879 RepID=UPI001ABA0835|nr:hypothetical protein [Burkholderia anthina]